MAAMAMAVSFPFNSCGQIALCKTMGTKTQTLPTMKQFDSVQAFGDIDSSLTTQSNYRGSNLPVGTMVIPPILGFHTSEGG